MKTSPVKWSKKSGRVRLVPVGIIQGIPIMGSREYPRTSRQYGIDGGPQPGRHYPREN